MKWDHIATNWPHAQEDLKQQWSKLTDDDLAEIKGKRPQLEGLLKQYYGYDDLKARSEVDAWLRQFE